MDYKDECTKTIRLLDECRQYLLRIKYIDKDTARKSTLYNANEMRFMIRNKLNRAYGNMSDASFYDLLQPISGEENVKNFNKVSEAADAFLSGNILFIKCTMLPARSLLTRGQITDSPMNETYDFGVQGVSQALNNLVSSDHEVYSCMCTDLQFKTFHYLFVYNHREKKNAADSANHYTDKVQNIIAGWLPNGDEGEKCRTMFETYFTDDIPTGTYITVTPYNKPVLSPPEIVRRWKEKIPFSAI